MDISVVYADKDRNATKVKAVAEAFAHSLSAQGYTVDLVNAYTEMGKNLTFADYVVVGCTATSAFGGKIPQTVSDFLKRAGTVSGKRCFAFVTKGGLRKNRTLQSLMKAMEAEGMYIKNFDCIDKPQLAAAIGKRLDVKRNNQ
jgi:hypothetical protein